MFFDAKNPNKGTDMAFLRLESNNPNFTFLIRKNPASGMLIKKLRHGTVFGFYSKNNASQYNCWFKDHNSLISYDPGKPFEYNDTTRYSAALFTNHCCDEFFRDLQLKNLSEDTEGFHHSLLINCIHAKEKYVEIFSGAFRDFQWDIMPLAQGHYRIKLGTDGTLRRLLCFASLFSLINAIPNGECEQYDDGLLVKYAKLIQYLDAPYFVRYVFKVNLIRREATFGKLKPYLNTDSIQLIPGNNFFHRMQFVAQNLDGRTIIDIGCGEGKYMRYAKKVDHYYAVERDESRRAAAERKCRKDQLENVTVLASPDELPQIDGRKTILLSEVIEHNSRDDALALLKRCLLPDSRVIVTTPNRDFNVYYEDGADHDESEGNPAESDVWFRHEDHQFELTEQEFREFIAAATAEIKCNVKFSAIGDKVDGISPQSGVVIDVQ